MADFEAPSFSLGLDFDLCDSKPQITSVTEYIYPSSSSNQYSVSFATFKDKHDEFETLIVDDSEPECSDSRPKLKRLRRGLTTASSSVSAMAEEHSTAVVDDGDVDLFPSQEDWRTGSTDQHLHKHHNVKRKQNLSTSCNNMRFQLTDSDSDAYKSSVSRKCNGSDSNSNIRKSDLHQHVKRNPNVSDPPEAFPNCYHYFFHDDPRIRELVQIRLPNFSPLVNMPNIDLEQPSTANIDYMGQFSFGESSKQAARTIKDKKNSTSRKVSRKSKSEEESQGWVNPKLGVNKVTTKGTVKRKVHTARQTAGHWLTGSNGKKVYVGKSGQELTGRGAYIQYKKEIGSGFKKVKKRYVTKKKNMA